MLLSEKITQNYRHYDAFLKTLEDKDQSKLLSLKMFYCVHMQINESNKKLLFMPKQIIRLVFKSISITFYKINLQSLNKSKKSALLSDTNIEDAIAKILNFSIIKFQYKITFNSKNIVIYKELFKYSYLLLFKSSLNKSFILSILHRLLDYLMVYHTTDIDDIEVLLVENDRTPMNLALIHQLREKNKLTIKYDNWLIDPINHNDVYCEYYYYPSLYHKKIIQSFQSNANIKYIKGGFMHWDNLIRYKHNTNQDKITIIYLTQFGIDIQEHQRYIDDIFKAFTTFSHAFEIIIKVHPRENRQLYNELEKSYQVVYECSDIYALISKADYTFSVFSTLSIEAKHIVNNSYFINYNSLDFDIVDYSEIGLDVISSKENLLEYINGSHSTLNQEDFIKIANCRYPKSTEYLKKFVRDA